MIKHIALLFRKAGLSDDAFIKRYEEGHVTLVNEVFPFFTAYRRNYVVPGGAVALDHIKNANARPTFDVITEFWFKDSEAVEALSKRSSETDAGERVSQDEAEFLEPARSIIVECEEHVTPAHWLRLRPDGAEKPRIKYIALASAKPGVSRAELISHYETNHCRLGVELLSKDGKSILAGYSRSYPITQGAANFEHLGYESQGAGFDVMSQFWFWTEDDFDTFRSMCAAPEISTTLSADEARFLDRDSIQTFLVDEYVSDF